MSSAFIDLDKVSMSDTPFTEPVAKETNSVLPLTTTIAKAAAQLPVIQTSPAAANPRVQTTLDLLTEADQRDLLAVLASKWGTKETQQIAEIRQADGKIKRMEAKLTKAQKSYEQAKVKTQIGREKLEKQKNKVENANNAVLSLIGQLSISVGGQYTTSFYHHMAEESPRWNEHLSLEEMFQLAEGQNPRAQIAANKARLDVAKMYLLGPIKGPLKQAEDLLIREQEDALSFAKELQSLTVVENEAKKRLDAATESLRKAQENLLKLNRR